MSDRWQLYGGVARRREWLGLERQGRIRWKKLNNELTMEMDVLDVFHIHHSQDVCVKKRLK